MANQVTIKGQVSLPKWVREHLGLKPGSEVEFKVAASGEVLLCKGCQVTKKSRRRSRFAAIRGSATVKLSTEEILALTRGAD